MKKVILIIGCVISFATSFAQDSLEVDSLANDSSSISHKTINTVSLNDVTKADADSAYIRNDYASAVQLYESLLQKGESAGIYYNLGNSYYKLANIAKAILNYERALLLKPGDSDIRFNLDMARSKTIDKVGAPSEMFLITWIKSIINLMGVNAWAKLGIASFMLLIISLLIYIFGKQVYIKKTGFIGAVVFLLLVIVTNIFAYQQQKSLLNRAEGIIMAPSVTVKSTPSNNGTDLFILHEGRKVSITDGSMKEWKEIRLEDGNVGWVPANTLETI